MRRLHQILEGESTLDLLLLRHRREADLQAHVHRALPQALASHVAVVDARSAQLELVADSGAAAALLRQRAPELLSALAREGWEFTAIRVRVQARLAREPLPKPFKKQLDGASAATILALAADLGESPLSLALRRLATLRGQAHSNGRDEPLEGVKDQDGQH